MNLIAATQNLHKLTEIRAITEPLGFRLLSLDEVGLSDLTVVEDGRTFEENAIKKAQAVSRKIKGGALADDSGLAVDFLGGAPGVHSARFAGIPTDDVRNTKKLLKMLSGVREPLRSARFVCVIALIWPGREPLIARGECAGRLLKRPRGRKGFGYDPVFVPDGETLTFAEMPPEQKNRISHRALALGELSRLLEAAQREDRVER